ncbi:MAG: GntR family transcriptional regulator [Vicinamibacteria bacterium]|nr:GntR family transcriptional regulator [Vicinamibacteria bacterium]
MTPPKVDPWMNRIQVLPADPRPIWSQIEEGLRRLLASGSLSPGDTVPSVRELATELRVNPATVSKAYQRLVGAGLMEVRRGDGTYVSAAPPAVRKSEQTRVIRQAAMNFASVAITHGADLDTAREALDLAWDELSNSEGGNR